MLNLRKTAKREGMFQIPSLGKLKCKLYERYHYFPNSDFNDLEFHRFQKFGCFFLLPFKRFRFLFRGSP